MSEENLEIVRAVLGAYRNPGAMAMVAAGEIDLGWVDPEVEWDASRLTELVPDLAGVYRGHDGIRAYWRAWFEAWSDLEFEVEALMDAGDEVVALLRDQRQRGRYSGIWTELPPYAQVLTLRDGKLVRWRIFPDQQSAIAALEPSFRAARTEDVPRLAELARAAYGRYVERIGYEPRPMTDDYAGVIDRFEVTVAERNGAIVALLAVGEDEDGFVVDNLAVAPEAQGAGLGRALLERADATALAAGFDSIYLYTHEMMTENLELYEHLGYVEYARRPVRDFEVVFMRKPLSR